jgi:hypothetical protein
MSQQAILDVLGTQRFREQRIFTQINHAEAQIIAGTPIDFSLAEFIRAQRSGVDR